MFSERQASFAEVSLALTFADRTISPRSSLLSLYWRNPIVAVVRHRIGWTEALDSPVSIIALRAGTLLELPQFARESRAAGKALFIYPELIEGLGRDTAAIEYLAQAVGPAGIVSTKRQILQKAASLGLLTVYQIFMIDTQAFDTGVKNAQKLDCDAVEVMPGALPNVVRDVCRLVGKPVVCAGLIRTEREVEELFQAGASAVATSSQSLWSLSASNNQEE